MLENGELFQGKASGDKNHQSASKKVFGEVVFNTAMTGYQEVFTDPSYCDQIVVMTYPLIGNYGITNDDYESLRPNCKAIIANEFCDRPSHWKAQKTIRQFMDAHGILGLEGVDTRKLVKILRDQGSMKGIIAGDEVSPSEMRAHFEKRDQSSSGGEIEKSSCKTPAHYPNKNGRRIALIDFGFKKSILTALLERECDVVTLPWNTSFEELQTYSPSGVVLSNGPGDPKAMLSILPTIKKIQETYPMFSICMGHQVFALANGADTEKLKFGHRGANHPVKDLIKDKVFITSQNHGYAVSPDSIKNTDLEVTQINLNDKTIEGLRHKKLPAFSVQYHPEANPGPRDTESLFDDFLELARTQVTTREERE